ncbi:MAG TPA: cupin domain-containing protein [Gaiellaceae bacterium]
MVNLEHPEFDEPRDHPGFRARRARLGYQLGTERLGLSLWEIEPGEAAYPYHCHLTEEEIVIVTEGRPSLRTPAGWRELADGEVVAFPRGEAGAHQLVNRTSEPVRFLAASTNGEPDIVFYLDSEKVGACERPPAGGGFRKFFRIADEVDYYEGETPPSRDAAEP